MTKERRKEYMRKYRAEHREKIREKRHTWKKEHKAEYRAKKRKYRAEDLNQKGITKNHIRVESNKVLEKTHSKLPGYEIHHCFGYENYKSFIYIPKELHLRIHKFLRDNKIPSDSDHWNSIREIVNSYNGYTYIRC